MTDDAPLDALKGTRRPSRPAPPQKRAAARGKDVCIVGTELYLLPIATRVPLKFGGETLTTVTCARACVRVVDRNGRTGVGWGETPLSVQWVWPAATPYDVRYDILVDFAKTIAVKWADFRHFGHPLEIGQAFQRHQLGVQISRQHEASASEHHIPLLAALLCCSPFDLALYDAYGNLHGQPVFDTFTSDYVNVDLSHHLSPAPDSQVNYRGQYPADYLRLPGSRTLLAWHLVGGLDPLTEADLTGSEPNDGHPTTLTDWIDRDGLECLKVKLCGTDYHWDYQRLCRVGEIAVAKGVQHLSTDYNCTVLDPAYVVEMLDQLQRDRPELYDRILYVEQPFPYHIEEHPIDVREVSRRKPLFMDESAHTWELVRLGRSLGWTGVALKTCKTLTGAILSLCWARSHGMSLMVQDLTNPMLAQIPHVLLAAHAPTLLGVETNATQFYPEASNLEANIHPGVYNRRQGRVDLSTLHGPGFGYQIDKIGRLLPPPVVAHGTSIVSSPPIVPRPHTEF